MIGKTISHYKILEKLGEGGMGVVYKAEDTKLKRLVALKFLPSSIMASEAEKARFVHEAQAAAALNHPNICTIYEIDEADGQSFIAMEFIEGQSLKEKIASGMLQVAGVIELATQVAEGLQAAHEKGITHRDLKPANVMITNKGQAKITDFGLAKLAGRTKLTKEGATLGTVAYMSPEQTRGEDVDHRTDIWSFGVVLYEMITGQLPFKGEYDQTVMYSIMNVEPEPMTGLRTGVPMELERIVSKCLEKAPGERYQSTAEIQVDLKKLEKRLETGRGKYISVSAAEAQKVRRRSGIAYLTAAIAGSLVIILAIWAYFNLQPKDTVPRLRNPIRITSALGHEAHPSWSPEGGRLAYDSNQSGNWDIWITQVTGGLPVNLTADHLGADVNPSWSPDGSQIAFWSTRDGGGVFVMPALGGIPRKILSAKSVITGPWSFHQWSQDGTKLACIVQDTTGFFVEIVFLRTRSTQRLPLPGTQPYRGDLSCSPDDRAFAYMDWYYRGVAGPVRVLRLADGKSILMSDSLKSAQYPFWSSDGRFLYYGSEGDIWQQRMRVDFVPEGPPELLIKENGQAPHWPRHGQRIYFKRRNMEGTLTLWELSLENGRERQVLDLQGRPGGLHPNTLGTDGKRLFFNWGESVGDIWVMDVERKE